MINYNQIRKISSKERISEEIIEKDYLIEFILYYLSLNEYLHDLLIFRGGTALKKIYFGNYRFLEDMDFIIKSSENFGKIENAMRILVEKANEKFLFGIDMEFVYEKDMMNIMLSYNIFDDIRAVKKLKLDIAKDDLIPAFSDRRILFAYPDFSKKLYIKTYDLESVASDKIGRILDIVNEPRDIYDLWHILKLDIDERKIKREYRKKYGYGIILDNLIREINKNDYRVNWEIRLKKQINNLQEYDEIIRELEELIRNKLL